MNALRIFGLQVIRFIGERMRPLMMAWLFLFFAFPSFGQLILQLDLGNLGAVPATSRQVKWQQLSPFPGNANFVTSDPSTGIAFITNPPVGPSLGVLYTIAITIQSPPGQPINFQVTMLPGDSGTIDASNRLSSPSPTFPAGLVSWAIATAETRYALSGGATNQYATFVSVSNIIASMAFTNQLAPGTAVTFSTNHGVVTINSTATGGTITNGLSTNTTGVIVVGPNIIVSTNYDALNAANSATNGMGLPSATAAFSNTNQFDGAGAALAGTNHIGVPSGLSAFAPTNQFDTNGAGGQAFVASSNMFVAGAGGPFIKYSNGNGTNLNLAGNATFGAWNITTNVGSGALVFSNAPSVIAATNHALVISNIVSLGVITNGGNVWVNGVSFSDGTISGSAGLNNNIEMTQLSPANTIQFTSGGLFSGIVYAVQFEGGNGSPVLGAIYWADSIHFANWLICTNPNNGYLLFTNSPSVIAGTNQTLVISNLTDLGIISGNLVGTLTNNTLGNASGSTNYFGATNGSGPVVLSTAPTITNATFNTFTGTNTFYMGGALFQQSLSVLAVTNSTAQGTYVWYPTPAAYSNVNNQAWVILSNTTCTFQSNGMSYYANSAILGQYSAIGGSGAPFPLVNEGGLFWHQGWLTLGPVLPGGDTNTWYWITNEAGTFSLSAAQLATNSLYAGLTNLFSGWITNSIISPNSVTNQAGFWAAAPSSSGSSVNAYYTNNPNAFPNVTAPNELMVISNLSVITNVYVGGTLVTTNIISNVSGNATNLYINTIPGGLQAVGNTTISAYNSVYQGSLSTTKGNLELPGNSQTNANQYSVTMGFNIYNGYSSVLLYNSSGILTTSTANNEVIFTPGNGFMVGTNASGGNTINTFGTNNATIQSAANTFAMAGNVIYQNLANSVIGMTNWSSSDINANGTYIQQSSTLWQNTNNAIYTLLTNGTVWAANSNGITLATSSGPNGPWTLTGGTGNTPGSYVGSQINEVGVQHTGPASFSNLNSVNSYSVTQTVINATIANLTAGTLNVTSTITGSIGGAAITYNTNTFYGINTNVFSAYGGTYSYLAILNWRWNPNYTADSGADIGGYTNGTFVLSFDPTQIGGFYICTNSAAPDFTSGNFNNMPYTDGTDLNYSNAIAHGPASGNWSPNAGAGFSGVPPLMIFGPTNTTTLVINGVGPLISTNNIYFDSLLGSDNLGCGNQAQPYKTLAFFYNIIAPTFYPNALTLHLANGIYSFPASANITNVSVIGNGEASTFLFNSGSPWSICGNFLMKDLCISNTTFFVYIPTNQLGTIRNCLFANQGIDDGIEGGTLFPNSRFIFRDNTILTTGDAFVNLVAQTNSDCQIIGNTIECLQINTNNTSVPNRCLFLSGEGDDNSGYYHVQGNTLIISNNATMKVNNTNMYLGVFGHGHVIFGYNETYNLGTSNNFQPFVTGYALTPTGSYIRFPGRFGITGSVDYTNGAFANGTTNYP